MSGVEPHGGNREALARRLGCRPDQLLDASASLVPFGPPAWLRRHVVRALHNEALTSYPDREQWALREAIAKSHGIQPQQVLPGNGAAELFTWIARDAAAVGINWLPAPGFADYRRALATWDACCCAQPLPLRWPADGPQPWPELSLPAEGVLWLTNPHNPTGQLWSRASLEPLLRRFALVVVDEAFLPLVPRGEQQSLVPWLDQHRNLVVIRSLTKVLSIPGLRLGYALGDPERLQRWHQWRDPWPVNGLAAAAGLAWFEVPRRAEQWQRRVQRWVTREGAWLQRELGALPGVTPMPSAANYLLIRGERDGQPLSLQLLREALETRHRILLRDCRSFEGLDDSWLRIGYQSRRGNRRIIHAMRQELPQALNSSNTPASN
ncbi:aminotransferase class I/II-fold pyridoxal phosphate-dependent enzyme [Synechococcus sp. CB0101]|uniref:pyridoxal phosphate-dependent aminotransferase n=1 Tax=Synechococcus sp. CB0101 TaxID=232348 RepID=UPI00020030AF